MTMTMSQRAMARFFRAVDDIANPATKAQTRLLGLVLGIRLGDPRGVKTLAGIPQVPRLEALKLLSSVMPASEPLATIARDTIFRGDETELSERIIGVWAGMSPEDARWSEMWTFDRMRAVARLIGSGYPVDANGLAALLPHLQTREADAAIITWCHERDFTFKSSELALIERVDGAPARLEAMAAVAARQAVPQEIAAEWLDAANDVASTAASGATEPFSVILQTLRVAAISHLAGQDGGLARWHGQREAIKSEQDPDRLRLLYTTAFETGAAMGFEPWLAAVEQLRGHNRVMKDLVCYRRARSEAIRSLGRAAAGSQTATDRGYGALKDLCRKVAQPYLTLLLHSVVAHHLAAFPGRSIEVQLSEVLAVVKRGIPRPINDITLDEVMSHLGPAAPERALAMTDQVGAPFPSAVWVGSLIPYLAASSG